MAFLEDCIERSTALAAACASLAFGGGLDPITGVVVGAVGIAGITLGRIRRHGAESNFALTSIRRRVSNDLAEYSRKEGWDNSAELKAADDAMARALTGCFLDRRALAAS